MAPMPSEEDFALFARRRVGAFGRKPREACDDGAYDDMTFEDKVGMRIDAEIEARDSGKIGKAVGTARFRLKGACVEGIYCLPDRSITRGRMARPATRARIEARENLVTISEGGGGKSRIAQALGVAACRKPMPVRYARLSDMFREPNVARSEGRAYDAPDRFARPDPLIRTTSSPRRSRTRPTRSTCSRCCRPGRGAARRCPPRSPSPTSGA